MKDKLIDKYIKIIGLPQPPYDPSWITSKFLIDEDKHLEVNVGQSALGYLKRCLKQQLTKVDNMKLKGLILPTWKHYADFCINCMNIDLWLLETDFTKPILAAKEICRLQPTLGVKALGKHLGGAMTGTYGLSFKVNSNAYVVLIDSNIYKDELKIQHEFSHYVEEVTGKLILDNDIKDEVKQHFNLQNQYVAYMLNEREFWVNIYNDFFNGLQKIYWLNFKKVYSWEKFIDFHFNELKKNAHDWRKSALVYLWDEYVKVNGFYLGIIAGLSYIKPDFYDEIVEKLKNR